MNLDAQRTEAQQRLRHAMMTAHGALVVDFLGGVYVQISNYGPGGALWVELPSNATLTGSFQLTADDEIRLLTAGMNPPSGPTQPNWHYQIASSQDEIFIQIDTYVRAAQVLALLVEAFHLGPADVYSCVIEQLPPAKA